MLDLKDIVQNGAGADTAFEVFWLIHEHDKYFAIIQDQTYTY